MRGLLNESPIHFDLLAHSQQPGPLQFPGKVLADSQGDRLYIADSNHHRIVATTLDGQLLETIGAGQAGREDGGYDRATFNHPQGMALAGGRLYVADTDNHLIRQIDLRSKSVSTIAGTGVQARPPTLAVSLSGRRGAAALRTALSSPWDLWMHGDDLLIAMAGPHQIWRMSLTNNSVGPYAGNGREDIVDGPLLPRTLYQLGYASLAQPSGLASDGQWLFVADSEGSSIRAVPLDPTRQMRTIVGTAALAQPQRLFTFGDRDGTCDEALLQHPLGVAYHQQQLYVADTYNNKIKVIDLTRRTVRTLAGTGQAGDQDDPAMFDEPAGITYAAGTLYVADTNNHRIRTIDLQKENRVATLKLAGLCRRKSDEGQPPAFTDAVQTELPLQQVSSAEGAVRIAVQLLLPVGWKINVLAPMGYLVRADGASGPVDRSRLGVFQRLKQPADQFEFQLPVTGLGHDALTISMNYYFCREGAEGLCRVGSVTWNVPLSVSDRSPNSAITLQHAITP